jgi:hypothetical protein
MKYFNAILLSMSSVSAVLRRFYKVSHGSCAKFVTAICDNEICTPNMQRH